MIMAVVLEELAFLVDTGSRHELLVFAQANQSPLPLTMVIVQPNIPVRRMTSERKTQLADALVRILSRFLTPAMKVYGYTSCALTMFGLGLALCPKFVRTVPNRLYCVFYFKSPYLGKWHLGVTIHPL